MQAAAMCHKVMRPTTAEMLMSRLSEAPSFVNSCVALNGLASRAGMHTSPLTQAQRHKAAR